MSVHSIYLTPVNASWLDEQIKRGNYPDTSAAINDLIEKARQSQEISFIRSRIEQAEASGFTSDSKEDILREAAARLGKWRNQ